MEKNRLVYLALVPAKSLNCCLRYHSRKLFNSGYILSSMHSELAAIDICMSWTKWTIYSM